MRLGSHFTEEQRAKMMGHPATGLKHYPVAIRSKIATSLMGHLVSPETRAKISAANTGQIVSLETRAKLSVSNKEAQNRPEVKARMSVIKMGHDTSQETRAKIAVGNTGKTRSPEERAKLSSIKKESCASPEWRAMISARNWRGGHKVSARKSRAKRRVLGFNPLNSPFLGCEGHHIDQNDVIYIPKNLHQSVKHCLSTGRNMEKMNALAGQYLTADWT
jgi:hypothetical protein